MKRSIILVFFVALSGAIAWIFFGPAENPILTEKMIETSDKTQGAVDGAKDAVTRKVEEWKLTPENIRAELAKTGRVVLSRVRVAGERMDEVRIVAVIKGKFVMDKNLSVLAISVGCRDGEVLLTGSVTSEENISRAVALALQTGGVRHVESQLVVKN